MSVWVPIETRFHAGLFRPNVMEHVTVLKDIPRFVTTRGGDISSCRADLHRAI